MVALAKYRGGNWLKCPDLGNREHLVTIEKIVEEDVGEGRKLVVYFEGRTKALALNDTNLEAIELAFGPDTADAVGGQMIAYVDPEVRYGGKKVGGIRLKLPTKAAAKEAATAKRVMAEAIGEDDSDW